MKERLVKFSIYKKSVILDKYLLSIRELYIYNISFIIIFGSTITSESRPILQSPSIFSLFFVLAF